MFNFWHLLEQAVSNCTSNTEIQDVLNVDCKALALFLSSDDLQALATSSSAVFQTFACVQSDSDSRDALVNKT